MAGKLCSCIPQRYVFAIMGFFATFVGFMIRLSVDLTISHKVNQTITTEPVLYDPYSCPDLYHAVNQSDTNGPAAEKTKVGPAGSHFGLLACLIVEVIGAWHLLRHPQAALLKLIVIVLTLFTVGLLPWIDNFAHAFGFVFGFLLSYGLLPFITFGPYERRRKIVLVWVCMVSAGAMTCALVALFYVAPAYECTWCEYFTCLPLAPDMCASQDVRVRQMDGV